MTTRALVLWMLAEGPLHGYRVRKALAGDAMATWFPVADESIYSCLRTLVRRGWARVMGESQSSTGRRRTQYAITRAGREELRETLRAAWRTPPAVADPFLVALCAESDLPAEEVCALIAERRRALRVRMQHVERIRKGSPAAALVERQLALTRAELRWLRQHERSR